MSERTIIINSNPELLTDGLDFQEGEERKELASEIVEAALNIADDLELDVDTNSGFSYWTGLPSRALTAGPWIRYFGEEDEEDAFILADAMAEQYAEFE